MALASPGQICEPADREIPSVLLGPEKRQRLQPGKKIRMEISDNLRPRVNLLNCTSTLWSNTSVPSMGDWLLGIGEGNRHAS